MKNMSVEALVMPPDGACSPASTPSVHEKVSLRNGHLGNQRVATWAIFSIAMEVVPLSRVAQTVDRLTAPCCTGG